MLQQILDIFLHLDKHLNDAVVQYGFWVYGLLFLIIFCETGLVVTPFLPGDSLLFAAGALAASPDSPLSMTLLFGIMFAAAVIGDTVNYHIGHYLGPKVLNRDGRFLKKKYLDRTHAYFTKYGGSTIILARFVPIVRTFAPFVAGIGSMTYWRFLTFNVVGAAIWVGLLLGAGYIFGQLPWVKDNFVIVELGIILVSVLPMAFEYLKYRRDRHKEQAGENAS